MRKETKILNDNSALKFLPKEWDRRQGMILDSLRFTIQMIEFNYDSLLECLENLSTSKETKIHFKIFNYAWGIIDHSQRFKLIYEKISSFDSDNIKRLDYLYSFRNAIQHLNKNIEDVHIANRRPIYGIVKWVYFDELNPPAATYLAVSGVFDVSGVQFKQHKQIGYTSLINDIKLEIDSRGKKEENEICLSKLLIDLKWVVGELEQSLIKSINSNNLKMVDWKSMCDVILVMKNDEDTV